MSVMTTFNSSVQKTAGFNTFDFWYHSLTTALIAEHIARNLPETKRDEVFLSGLLHDFSIIILNEFYPELFERILEETVDSGCRFFEATQKILGISPNDFMKVLFTTWKIPPNIIASICNRVSILNAKTITGPAELSCLTVAMSNIIAKAFCFGEGCEQYSIPIGKRQFEYIKMPTGLADGFVDKIKTDLALYRSLLKVEDIPIVTTDNQKKIGFINLSDFLFLPVIEYLKVLGHSITTVQIPPSFNHDLDQKFDSICVVANSDITLKQISPLFSLYQRSILNVQQSAPLPIFALVPPNSALAREIPPPSLSLLYNEGDLRQFEELMLKVVGREQVLFPTKAPDIIEYIPEYTRPALQNAAV